ncbi:MAG: hypothetical protein J5685_08485 [Clostridiales bacterium]|nr:hypothetical protein [Clostridiales bacterium]
MTTDAFIRELCSIFGEEYEGVYDRAVKCGWLDTEDLLFKDRTITRKNAARIIHMYLLKVSGLSDISGISGAEKLRDLYDCRVCTNHVAQVYLRGIMDAKDLSKDGGFLWFDLDGEDDPETNRMYLKRAAKYAARSLD